MIRTWPDPGKAAPGAGFRRFQHLGPRGHHDPGPVGPSRRGLRSLARGALRGFRASSANFTAARDCATIPPAFWPSSSSCWRRGRFDVLLPTHEQGFLFARARQRLEGRVGLALPGFESYRAAHSKAGFSRLLDQLELAAAADADRDIGAASCATPSAFPSVVKTSVGTASRGIWFVRNDGRSRRRAARSRRRRRVRR